jgi:hypothetical protein
MNAPFAVADRFSLSRHGDVLAKKMAARLVIGVVSPGAGGSSMLQQYGVHAGRGLKLLCL